jgi:hypothetical protein
MGMAASTGTWITGMTLAMDTTGRCRDVERSSSTTSRAMRLGMGMGTSGMPATMLVESERCRDTMVAVVGTAAGITAVATRGRWIEAGGRVPPVLVKYSIQVGYRHSLP